MEIQNAGNEVKLIKLRISPQNLREWLIQHTEIYRSTARIELLGRLLRQHDFPAVHARRFVGHVCRWGRGHRNIDRVLSENTANSIADALRDASQMAENDHVADGIVRIAELGYLGVSFASKQMRFLHPCRAVILDKVIREGFGYRESRNGYEAFLNDCQEIFEIVGNWNIDLPADRPPLRICDVEAALFMAIRG